MAMNKNIIPEKKSLVDNIKSVRLYIIIIGLFTLILYGNTIPNDYSFDDIYVTNNKDIVKGFSIIPELFTSLYANMYEDGKPLTFGYRPIVKISFALEYGFFGANPHISHIINLLLYALTCILIFNILRKLFKNYHIFFPFIITLLFIAHPSHTEIVSSLKNRDELLSFLGAIATLYLFIRYFETGKIYLGIIGLIVFLLAFLSKPTVSVFIPIYPLVLYFFTKPKTGQVLFFILGILVIAYLANFMPRLYLPKTERPVQFIENPLYYIDNFWIKAATGMTILLFYLKMLIFPHPLVFYYGYDTIPVADWGNVWVYVSVLIHLGLFVYAISKLKEKHILSFGILIYLASVATFSNVFKLAMGIVADRFMYYPSLGFVIILAWILFRIFKIDPKAEYISGKNLNKLIVLLLLILIPYSGKTIVRNSQWKDQVTLLKSDIDHLEKSAKANFIYSGTMKGEVMRMINEKKTPKNEIRATIDDILFHLDRALDIYPDYYQAYDLRGSIFITFYTEYDRSISDFSKAIEIKPNYIPAFYGLGYCYMMKENLPEAIKNYEKTIELDPDHIQAYVDLSKIYRKLGNIEKSESYVKQAAELRSKFDEEFEYGKRKRQRR